ncbi:hypothetical protein FA13DRAFT_1794240 [Coprinellus micaceus]|uniref:Uncharacterized protein n=1 Tax=Coprinellus micaceus TaxID=71717 RepID=A0A4Y7T277_COPMI|nr:hypothetical protein FA13DRAFT_1794240 [Coprinellus micaceus]
MSRSKLSKYAEILLGLNGVPLVQQPMSRTPARSRSPKAFALKEGADTFSPKDFITSGRPGGAVANGL